MQILTDRAARAQPVSGYESLRAWAARLADGVGEAHAYLLRFDVGGAIGRHEAGFGQLFIVVAGQGWVSGGDGLRTQVRVGDVVLFARGEQHAKGSESGMTAVMVQVRDLAATDDATA